MTDSVTAPHPLWTRFQKAADDARQRGDLERAERWLLAAAGVAGEHCPQVLEETFADLRLVYEQAGRHEDAEQLSRSLGDLDSVAISMVRRGAYDEAEEMLRELAAADQATGDREARMAHLLGLSRVQHDAGRYAAAEATLKQVLATAERLDPDVEEALGRLYEDQGRYADAREVFARVMARREGMDRRARLAWVLHLAWLDTMTGSDDEAEALLLECLDHIEPEDASMAIVHCLQGLAVLAERAGSVFEAEGYYREALDRRLPTGVATMLKAALARVLEAQEGHEEALALADAVLREDLDPLTAASLHETRARALRSMGRDASAAESARDGAVRAWEALAVEVHPDEARSLDHQAAALRAAGFEALAERAAARSAEIRAASPGRRGREFQL